MKAYYSFLFLGLLGLSLGQGYGGSSPGSSGGFTIVDPYSLDDYGGSSVIMLDTNEGGYVLPNPSEEYLSHTPKPKRGAGGAQGSEVGVEGESGSLNVVYSGPHYVAERGTITVICILSHYHRLKWTHNGKPVVSGEGGYTTMDLPAPDGYLKSNLTVESAHVYHAGEYKCTPFSPRSHSVYVISGDPQGEDIQVLFEGRPVKIFCNLTAEGGENNGTPTPKTEIPIEWFKDDKPIVEGEKFKIIKENFTLVIENSERADAGDYKCVLNTASERLSRDHKLIFLEIRRLEKSQNVDEKQPFSIECPVDGIPEPSIIWMKNQKPMYDLMVNDSRISLGPNSNNITNGTLTIINAEWGDRGNYSCNITIFSYNFEKWTFLRVKDIYAALWPFIGIVIEVVILGIIIIIFEKRRAKAEFDESDTDQGNDQKNIGKDRRRK
ncbi:neuroplastin-like isoform X1 [Palaemon carinicauda]|uniref:neuroplastin-like isoform X1 n=1 Tax=Palaemon carinicauda TaxID=392227 RepID=UPI0035B5744D